MPDPDPLPPDDDFVFLSFTETTLKRLQDILAGIEADVDVHPVDPSYPTRSWVLHFYKAVTTAGASGFAIVYDVPPEGDTGQHPIQAAEVTGADDAAKAKNAAALIGKGNDLIGYEDLNGPQRVVVFRETGAAPPAPAIPDSLSWDNVAARKPWSKLLLSLAAQNRTDLEKGNPHEFIPGYETLKLELQIKFWAELWVAIANFESSWNPDCVFPESFGVNSVGLLQLSLSDQQTVAYHLSPHLTNENQLKDPSNNLNWGVTIFTYWLVKDRVVASGAGNSSLGAARYWSTLRVGHKVELIKALTKKNVGL